MTSKTFVAAAAVAALLAAGSASAQTAAAPAQPTHGPPIAGLCMISLEGAAGASTVGKWVNTRMGQILSQVNAELNAEKTAIDNEAKSLDSQRAALDPTVFEQRGSALQVRANALRRKAELRDRELGATQQKALARISQEMEPLVKQAYQQKNCSMLIRSDALVYGSPAMDLTPAVTTALNAKITQFAFDRERLDQAQAAAGAPPIAQTPGATRPATPAPTRK